VAVLVRRYGICEATLTAGGMSSLSAGESSLASGKGKAGRPDRQIQDLQKQLEERDRVIGELTIANRILKKHSEACTDRIRQGGPDTMMSEAESKVR
jgi:hypothetical protein